MADSLMADPSAPVPSSTVSDEPTAEAPADRPDSVEDPDAVGATDAVEQTDAPDKPRTFASSRTDKLPVKMLSDRILVNLESDGERRSTGGILIPATAQLGRRLAWGEVVALGPNVRSMEVGDQVLFNPEDRYEVEVRGADYIILRERDVHAVASKRLEEGSTGLYL